LGDPVQASRRIFLTAEWLNLLMLNYAVDPSALQRFVPSGTELDTFDGRTYVSLVGFQFNRTRVLGFAIPFHQNFEEVNVRFYVRRAAKRGVVFIRELVPKRAIAAVARWVFNEKYQRVPMSHRIETRPDGDVANAEYAWQSGLEQCVMNIETEGPGFIPDEGSASQFITEHYWGLWVPRIRSSTPAMVRLEGEASRLHGKCRRPLRRRDRTNPHAQTRLRIPCKRVRCNSLQGDKNGLTRPPAWGTGRRFISPLRLTTEASYVNHPGSTRKSRSVATLVHRP